MVMFDDYQVVVIIIKVFQGVINIMVGIWLSLGLWLVGLFSSDDDSRKESKIHEY